MHETDNDEANNDPDVGSSRRRSQLLEHGEIYRPPGCPTALFDDAKIPAARYH